jgi:hypothetical protein
MSIVCDLEEFETSFFDENVDLRGPCVDRVFDELFQGVGRTLNNFPRSNFVNDLDSSAFIKT